MRYCLEFYIPIDWFKPQPIIPTNARIDDNEGEGVYTWKEYFKDLTSILHYVEKLRACICNEENLCDTNILKAQLKYISAFCCTNAGKVFDVGTLLSNHYFQLDAITTPMTLYLSDSDKITLGRMLKEIGCETLAQFCAYIRAGKCKVVRND